MKKGYETVLIMDALLPDEEIDTTIKQTQDFLAKNGEVKKVDRPGKRRLAYSIKHKTHGYYAVFSFDSEGAIVSKLDRRLRLNEKVLRFLTVVRAGKE